MINSTFVWVDLQRNNAASGLFESLPSLYNAYRVKYPIDIASLIAAKKPGFLCFEFDIPSVDDLYLLQKTKQNYPEIPILMISNSHTEALVVWAFRSGVRDYLVKPCSQEYLHASIENLAQLSQRGSQEKIRMHLFPPFPLSVSQLTVHSERVFPKTTPALEYINQHYCEDIRLSDLAELCHLSESVFSRLFKKEHSINFSEYLMKMRIQKACEMLKSSGVSIQVKSVAFGVGFNDLSYFTRTFKRFKGITPSEYQRHSDTICAA